MQTVRLEDAKIGLHSISVAWPSTGSSDSVSCQPPPSPTGVTLEVCAEVRIGMTYSARCCPGDCASPFCAVLLKQLVFCATVSGDLHRALIRRHEL